MCIEYRGYNRPSPLVSFLTVQRTIPAPLGEGEVKNNLMVGKLGFILEALDFRVACETGVCTYYCCIYDCYVSDSPDICYYFSSYSSFSYSKSLDDE
jgi:hypothetical protein